jgi:hypothetical protein
MLTGNMENEPLYYCFGCHREGTMSDSGNRERIRTCEICGLKFCHYCGHVDEASLSFLCDSCWKERSKRLVKSGRYDEAIAILEMLQKFDDIEEIVRMREGSKPVESKSTFGFERLIVREDGKLRTATKIQGITITDHFISCRGKKGLLNKAGWRLGPVFTEIFRNFRDKLHLQGSYILDTDKGSVRSDEVFSVQMKRRYYVFERLKVEGSTGEHWAFKMDDVVILDSEAASSGKKDLIRKYGWEMVTILIRLVKAGIHTAGHYIYDTRKGSIHVIKSLKKL